MSLNVGKNLFGGVMTVKTLALAWTCLIAAIPCSAGTIYVDASASPGGDGTTWPTAYKFLQDGLSAAEYSDQIRVAQGTYTPDCDSVNPSGTGDRSATFQLKNGVTIKGGYAGLAEQDPAARDIELYETILSGDLNGDDGPHFANYNENSYHVIVGGGTGIDTIIDGFVITAGNADRSPFGLGGGVANFDGLITNCTVTRNFGTGLHLGIIGGTDRIFEVGGGGIHGCDGAITNCLISGNATLGFGGGISQSSAAIINCTIVGNYAEKRGGAFTWCDGLIANCIIWNNRSAGSSLHESYAPHYSCLSYPLFVNPGHWIGDYHWIEGDYHLLPESPCVNTGNYAYCMALPCSDRDGGTRFVGGQIDIGCFEANSTPDTDGDWLGATEEILHGTDPEVADSDGDKLLDGLEIMLGTNPLSLDPPRTYRVPESATSIQEALFFSRSGEHIVLSEGMYLENIYIGGRNILLTSTDPNDWSTVRATTVSGGHPPIPEGPVVTFSGTEDNSCQIRGITITGGYSFSGGGLYGAGTESQIANCEIRENSADFYGGGLAYCDGPVTDCLIFNNETHDFYSLTGDGSRGGGLYACSGPFVNCTISYNSSGRGGGMYNTSGSNLTLTDCTFSGNSADDGGGMYNDESSPTVADCTFTGNSADDGGGMYNDESSPTVADCTFTGNSAVFGGGGMINENSSPIVTNCILWGNTAASGDNEIYNWDDNSTPLISYCDIAGSGGSSSWDPNVGTDGGGNIDDDPLFEDPNGHDGLIGTEDDNLRLSADSPCIDTGDNSVVDPNSTDLEGNPRIVNAIVDMGAYEHQFPMVLGLYLSNTWMYHNVLSATLSKLTATVSITDDAMANSSYTYEWEFILPDDVTIAPTITAGGGFGDPCCTFAAPSCNEAGGLSDSGQALTVRVTVTGDDYGNTGIAEAQFGIALLGDVNNDKIVNLIDRIIMNVYWRTGSAGDFTFRDCNINCDDNVNLIDRIIANEIWRGNLGSGSVSSPCPFR